MPKKLPLLEEDKNKKKEEVISQEKEVSEYKRLRIPKAIHLTDLLIERGIIDKTELDKLIDEQRQRPEKLYSLLIKKNIMSEEELARFLAKELGIPYIKKDKLKEIQPEVKELIPEFIARRELIIPIKRIGNTLTVAMVDPLNVFTIDQLAMRTKLNIEIGVATETDIKEAIDRCYAKVTQMEDLIKRVEAAHKTTTKRDLETEEENLEVKEDTSSVIDLVNYILIEAIKAGASDIHIESFEERLRTRYRIDGILYEVGSYLPKSLHNSILSRIKIMGKMDIAEKRLPQDGRCKVRLNGKDIDLRISTMPTTFGEKVAIRILDASSLCLDLTQLGFESETLAVYKKNIQVPYGIILVTGPTGSGKTTTLYSTLSTINSPDKNIITIEDPVEYVLPGINQVQVKPDIGLDFASGLRTFVRQDPDIIMVGEIRDRETAEVAINAALTGHLVFSTLHTNDAVGSVTRLINMGIEPFLITSTVVMSIAQRLLRVICENCKRPYTVSMHALTSLGLDLPQEKLTFYRGVGCESCMNIGYKGRTGIFEIMTMDEELKEAVLNREPAHVLKEIAVRHGMMTLREAALKKVLAGVTTIEEMLRLTFEES